MSSEPGGSQHPLGLPESWDALRDLTDEDIIERYEKAAVTTHTELKARDRLPYVVGAQFYLDELRRREAARREATMIRLTRWITFMTAVVTVATVVNVVVFFYSG